jgi:hypothetical protein
MEEAAANRSLLLFSPDVAINRIASQPGCESPQCLFHQVRFFLLLPNDCHFANNERSEES